EGERGEQCPRPVLHHHGIFGMPGIVSAIPGRVGHSPPSGSVLPKPGPGCVAPQFMLFEGPDGTLTLGGTALAGCPALGELAGGDPPGPAPAPVPAMPSKTAFNARPPTVPAIPPTIATGTTGPGMPK